MTASAVLLWKEESKAPWGRLSPSQNVCTSVPTHSRPDSTRRGDCGFGSANGPVRGCVGFLSPIWTEKVNSVASNGRVLTFFKAAGGEGTII
jgi:hypothetical protein